MPDEDSQVKVAILEQQVEHLKERLEEKDKEQIRRLDILEDKMDQVLLAHSRYKGAWGMLLLISSGIWAGVVFMKDFFMRDRA